MKTDRINFIFFGTSEFSVIVLDELEIAGFLPEAIICGEDKPVGRKMVMTPPLTKVWAEKRNIKVFQPKKLDSDFTNRLKTMDYELSIVASYGKIIPQPILDIPKHGTLNVHPSLLPKLRGPSPIKSAILTENETGVSVMLLDAEMDHGPIIAQEKTVVAEWPPYADELEKMLGHQGGKVLAQVLPDWIAGKIKPQKQDHTKATYCKKIEKEDGLLDLSNPPEKNLRKIRAYSGWPNAYFFMEKNGPLAQTGQKIRVIITKAHLEKGELIIEKVIPEGKKEMPYKDFRRGLKF